MGAGAKRRATVVRGLMPTALFRSPLRGCGGTCKRTPQSSAFAVGALAAPDSNRTHLRTLRALCDSGFRHKLAAAALGVHAHTLSYRLAQIRRLHGIDLDDAQTRLRVHLALLILDV